VVAKLNHDLASMSKILPPNCKMGVKLTRSTPDFSVVTDPTYRKTNERLGHFLSKGYRVRIEKIEAEILRFKLADRTVSYLESRLARSAAKFYFTRVAMRFSKQKLGQIGTNCF